MWRLANMAESDRAYLLLAMSPKTTLAKVECRSSHNPPIQRKGSKSLAEEQAPEVVYFQASKRTSRTLLEGEDLRVSGLPHMGGSTGPHTEKVFNNLL